MDISKIESCSQAYIQNLPNQSKAQLALFNALWGIMARTSAQAALTSFTPDVARLENDLREGLPFMSDCPIEVDAQSLADVVELLTQCLVESGVYQEEICDALRAIDMRMLIATSDMDLASVNPEQYLNSLVEIMSNYGFDGSHVTVLVGLVSFGLRALQESAANIMVKSVDKSLFDSAHSLSCPVCGGRPTLAILTRQKNASATGRKLACLQCGTEWEFDRIRCPHCGTDDVHKLGFRTLKSDNAHRIDYCENCGNYIRTAVVETANSPYSIDVEDCVMAALDSYADEDSNQAKTQ